ncbi:ImmA/IrrE family metallo-endopeptidase [Microbacterium resistens]|uniref:ImmA/IrrE family metallo-endopeptidase n=1 Tax=Microbacterium resistens TaxID=156977 RepID=UPI00366BA776
MDAKLRAIYDMIDALGVTVDFCELPPDMDGEYIHADRLILIQFDLLERRYRSTLAHECCHAVYQDVPSMFGPVNAKAERRADEWAALRLIELDEYRTAEARHDGHDEAMAIQLRVTTDLVHAYRRLLLRTDAAVYVAPRMGDGQWTAKVEAA